MNFGFIVVLTFLMLGAISTQPNITESKKSNPAYTLNRSPLANRFSLIGTTNAEEILKMKKTIEALRKWEKENSEREASIYRKYLANRIKGSMARDFLTLRYWREMCGSCSFIFCLLKIDKTCVLISTASKLFVN